MSNTRFKHSTFYTRSKAYAIIPAPVRTVAPVAMPMPNVSSYRPVQQVTLPPPVISRPPQIIQPQMPTVRQIQTIPTQTAVVSPVAQVPVQRPPVITGTTIKPVPVRPVPVVSQVRPVPVPAQPVPVRPAPMVSQIPVQQVPVVRPPVAAVTPVNIAPNVRMPIQAVNPIGQPMVKPPVYTASTYRPSMRRNMGGVLGNRQVIPVVNNTLNNTTGYTTRTYRPRRL